jgi:predicted metal-binding membrane protein
VIVLVDRLAGGRVLGMHSARVTAVVLGAAALYQLTPLKLRCLNVCRSPLSRIVRGWRDGLPGAFRMGVENGLWCAGCCAGAMLVLLAVGIMSIWWMALAGAAISVEKRAFAWAT